jgi:hypothetical protein
VGASRAFLLLRAHKPAAFSYGKKSAKIFAAYNTTHTADGPRPETMLFKTREFPEQITRFPAAGWAQGSSGTCLRSHSNAFSRSEKIASAPLELESIWYIRLTPKATGRGA